MTSHHGAVTRDTFTVVNDPGLPLVRVTGHSRDKFTMEISMVTSKRRKKPSLTFNVVNSCVFRYPRLESQSGFFI